MTNERFLELVAESYAQIENNFVSLPNEEMPLTVLDMPLTGFATADDPIFKQFREPAVIGSEFRTPMDYMPSARTIVAFFFPFNEQVRAKVRTELQPSSPTWNAAYGMNTALTDAFLDILIPKLTAEGAQVFQPNRDPGMVRNPELSEDGTDLHFNVSWSNRHALYAAGLGTFGVHRHIITEKGCCGTTASFITDLELMPTERHYSEVYEWCSHCGSCATRCPSGAIPRDGLRNLRTCSSHATEVRKKYGGFCGKCLTGIPCEDKAPAKSKVSKDVASMFKAISGEMPRA